MFPLTHNCQVSKITTDIGKKRTQYLFKVSTKIIDEEIDEKDGNADSKESKNKTPKKKSSDGSGAKVAAAAVGGVVVGALTAGVGLLTGMVLVGAGAAAGGGAAALANNDSKERSVILGCDTYQEAVSWVNSIEFQIQEISDSTLGNGVMTKLGFQYQSKKSMPHPDIRIDDVEEWITNTRWKVVDTYEGLRILEPWNFGETEIPYNESFFFSNSSKNIDIVSNPCMRVNLNVGASSWDAFSAIMNFSNPLKSGIVHSIRVVENIDNGTDVIHLKLNPVYLQPTWTGNSFLLLWMLNYSIWIVVLFFQLLVISAFCGTGETIMMEVFLYV